MLEVKLRDRKDGPISRWPSIMEKDAFAISEALKNNSKIVPTIPKLNLTKNEDGTLKHQSELQESLAVESANLVASLNLDTQNYTKRNVKLRSEPRILSPKNYDGRLSSAE